MIGKRKPRHSGEALAPVAFGIESQTRVVSPKEILLQKAAKRLAIAFGDEVEDETTMSGRLASVIRREALEVSQPEKIVNAKSRIVAFDGNADELNVLVEAFGIALPDSGLNGLRALLGGLRELGQDRTLELPRVKQAGETRVTLEDAVQLIDRPTIIIYPSALIEQLVIPSPEEDGISLVFSGTGLTAPYDTHTNPYNPENAVLIDLIIRPPLETVL